VIQPEIPPIPFNTPEGRREVGSWWVGAHARTQPRSHARTQPRMHARTHTQPIFCLLCLLCLRSKIWEAP